MADKTTTLAQQFLQDRSRENFSLLYRECSGALLRTAFYLCGGRRERAEDIVQETWVTAIEKLEHFQARSGFKTWITGILINKFREQQRKDRAFDPLERAREREVKTTLPHLAIDLQNAILRLPDGYREVLTLHDIEGFKHPEIAGILGIVEGTSKSQLFQARKTMRQLLSGYKEEEWKH